MLNNESIFANLFNWFKKKPSIIDGAVVNEISKPIQQESTKCPQCGNVVELLLPCMGFGDPVVYKCVHCQCTIIAPGTSTITESGKLIPSWSKQESIISFSNGEIKFVGRIHGSVGREYEIIYPQESFRVYRNITYCHPEMMKAGMCGADEATIEYKLKPLKTGLFCITEEIHFRGNLEERYIHYFLVE